jgi:uncharacterized membrane protein
MDPIVMIVVPGLAGGLVIALLIALQRRSSKHRADTVGENPSTDVINMARIRVAGVGGLGLIAMAAVVAWFVPRIGQTLLIGLVLGLVFAAVMILRRRQSGPMSTSGRRPGANVILSIDEPMTPAEDRVRRPQDRSMCGVEPAPRAL